MKWLFLVFMLAVMIGPSFYVSEPLSPASTGEQGRPQARIIPPAPEKATPGISSLGEDLSDPSGLNKEHPFHPIILEAANRYDVDPALVKAIIMVESGYNPRAVSKRGAKGLMQLMPRTARSMGVIDSFNPEHNVNGGVRYFKKLLNQLDGDIELSLAAYNAGIGKVRKFRGIPPYRVTRSYVRKVFSYYRYYKEKMSGGTKRA